MRGRFQPRADEAFTDLLTAARAGGQWAYERLYRSLAPAVAGYLRVQGAAEPEDLTSEVFERAFGALGTFSGGEAQFRSWMFTIAHHRLTDERRRVARRPATSDSELPELPAGDVEDDADRRMATERVRRLCDGLAPDQRDVLLLRMLADLTVDDIAAALGKSPGAVKALQRRGLAALRRQIERQGVPL
ncbi:MAG TPA: sigma-70 family RNA polymerase sigma factor [Acidimicrobiales bacterium]|nr:sigma-70 family RNA polymerase sigma factor [Acidimicrobiales bacterium]